MAFTINTLEAVGGQSRRGRSFQKYVYRTADTIATVTAANYFLSIKSKLDVGDVILVEIVTYAADGTTVTARSGGFVMTVAVKTSALFYVHATATEDTDVLVTKLADISTASVIALTSNVAGDIINITTVLAGVITTGNAAITFDIGGVAIENSAITVAHAGSAVGTLDTSYPTGLRTVKSTNVITMTSDGGSTVAQALYVVYEIAPNTGGAAGKVWVQTTLANISAASSAWVVSPVAGKITRIHTIIDTAITVGDATITAEINTVAVTDSSITIANVGSAAGTIDSSTPTAANTVAVGDAIEIITNGGSTDTSIAQILIEITV